MPVHAARPATDVAVARVELAGEGVVDLEDLGVVLDPGDDRVSLGGLTEEPGEGLVLVGVEVLSREEDHLALQPHLADGGDGVGGEIGAEVDAPDLGADGAGQRGDVELGGLGEDGHVRAPSKT